jgi:hypothetical protein
MIAIITSTIKTSNAHSFFPPEERAKQTLRTIERLYEVGFKDIFLFDNSIEDISKYQIQQSFKNVRIFHHPQYTFKNKGLSEALMILNNIHELPSEVPVFKISGRYYPSDKFNLQDFNNLQEKDFIGWGKDFDRKVSWFSTVAYSARNKAILEDTLVATIEEMLSYGRGIHGPRSFFKSIQALFGSDIGVKYTLAVEIGLARILKANKNYHLLNKLNVDGYLAGTTISEFISL